MRTFDGFQVVFTEGLFALKHLVYLSPDYHAKEQQLGRYCYEAEEQLPSSELRLLKATLGLDERAWRRYKKAWVSNPR